MKNLITFGFIIIISLGGFFSCKKRGAQPDLKEKSDLINIDSLSILTTETVDGHEFYMVQGVIPKTQENYTKVYEKINGIYREIENDRYPKYIPGNKHWSSIKQKADRKMK